MSAVSERNAINTYGLGFAPVAALRRTPIMWHSTLFGGRIMFKNAFKVKFSVKLMCQIALLAALEIVFNRFLSINTEALKIGFAFVPIVVCAIAFGPIWAGVTYALADAVGALLFPTGPFMVGITVDCFLMGFIFGLFLYRSEDAELNAPMTWVRIIAPIVINCLVFGLVLNSYWLSLIYTKRSFYYFFSMRLVEYAVLIPVQIIITPVLMKFVGRMRRSRVLSD
jgi:ECF transporter S component (folate family)